jgi:transcription elongation factor Elf1
MRLHPFDECVKRATELMERGADIYQQFNCATCGVKQTMDKPNAFYTHGICDKCGAETDIKTNGCNYAVHFVVGTYGSLSR